MSYAEAHIEQEALRLERAEAFVDADRQREIHRQLVGESERTMAVHALNRRNSAMATAAGRIFKSVDRFLSGQSRQDEFPARLFWSCPDDVRWRFCADALRDKRISRATKAQLVAWMMYLPAMNVPGRSEALMQNSGRGQFSDQCSVSGTPCPCRILPPTTPRLERCGRFGGRGCQSCGLQPPIHMGRTIHNCRGGGGDDS